MPYLTSLVELKIGHCQEFNSLNDIDDDEDMDDGDDIKWKCLNFLHSLSFKLFFICSLSLWVFNMLLLYISKLTSLEQLQCSYIPNLASFSSEFRSLQLLKMIEIPNLMTFPKSISNLTSLEELEIVGFTNFSSWGESLVTIINLLNLMAILESISNLTTLKHFQINLCSNTTSLLNRIHYLLSKQKLKIANCPHLEKKI